MTGERTNRAVKAKEEKITHEAELKASRVAGSRARPVLGRGRVRGIIPTAVRKQNPNAQNRGRATTNNGVSLRPIIKLTRAFAHAASDKIAR